MEAIAFSAFATLAIVGLLMAVAGVAYKKGAEDALKSLDDALQKKCGRQTTLQFDRHQIHGAVSQRP